MTKNRIITNPPLAKLFFESTKSSWFWLLVRLYLGFEWVMAGSGKIGEAAWTGDNAGVAVKGFVAGALEKTGGAHPDVQGWYAAFLENAVIPNAELFGHLIAWGELLVGIALIIGAFTGIAAFFGMFMNLNFLLAGAVSTNPILFILGIGVVLAWKVAGYYGVDRWLLPKLGTPWKAG